MPRNLSNLDRRSFIKHTAMGTSVLMTSSVLSPLTNAKEPMTLSTFNKPWAKQSLRGGESFILPSLNPDLLTLDEEGIRRDVRHAIAQGFCSIMPLTLGVDQKTDRLMREVIADEAKNKINIVGIIRAGTWKDKKDSIRLLEQQGVSHALMYFNPNLPNQEAIYQQMREIIDNTQLGIILYAKPSNTLEHLDPTGLPLDALDRLANLDSVIGIKFTQELRPATSYAVAERLGDRLLLGVVDLELMLALSAKYPMQWTGQWGIDCLQSPEQPWVNQFLALLREGKHKQAYDLYWKFEPIATSFYQLQAPSLRIGGHPWLHIKYMQWLTGGNGGLLANLNESADMVPHLDAAGRLACREIFAKVGIKTIELPDEAFVIGSSAYERGVRSKDFPALPQYVA